MVVTMVVMSPSFRPDRYIIGIGIIFIVIVDVLFIIDVSAVAFFQMIGIWVENPMRIIGYDEDNLEIENKNS